jgi:hypothetical protein
VRSLIINSYTTTTATTTTFIDTTTNTNTIPTQFSSPPVREL